MDMSGLHPESWTQKGVIIVQYRVVWFNNEPANDKITSLPKDRKQIAEPRSKKETKNKNTTMTNNEKTNIFNNLTPVHITG